jgi:hypothetical protein
MIEDGVVDSPPSRAAFSLTVSSFSPLRAKSRTMAQLLGSKRDSRSSGELYKSPFSSILFRVLKVFSKNSTVLRLFV